MISFNVPPFIGTELDYVKQAIDAHKICGDGQNTKKCHAYLEERFGLTAKHIAAKAKEVLARKKA